MFSRLNYVGGDIFNKLKVNCLCCEIAALRGSPPTWPLGASILPLPNRLHAARDQATPEENKTPVCLCVTAGKTSQCKATASAYHGRLWRRWRRLQFGSRWAAWVNNGLFSQPPDLELMERSCSSPVGLMRFVAYNVTFYSHSMNLHPLMQTNYCR